MGVHLGGLSDTVFLESKVSISLQIIDREKWFKARWKHIVKTDLFENKNLKKILNSGDWPNFSIFGEICPKIA